MRLGGFAGLAICRCRSGSLLSSRPLGLGIRTRRRHMSFNEATSILAITLLVSIPWITALVLALKDVSRNPSGFTYLLLVVVAVGSMPVAFVYLAYRVWRNEPHAQRNAG